MLNDLDVPLLYVHRSEGGGRLEGVLRTCGELGTSEFSGVQEGVKILLLGDGLQLRGGVQVRRVLKMLVQLIMDGGKSITRPVSCMRLASLAFLLMMARPRPLGLRSGPFVGACQIS